MALLRVCDEGPNRGEYLPGNRRSKMRKMGARLLSQLIVETYPAHLLMPINKREKSKSGSHTFIVSW
jgi:hypothetical protein